MKEAAVNGRAFLERARWHLMRVELLGMTRVLRLDEPMTKEVAERKNTPSSMILRPYWS